MPTIETKEAFLTQPDFAAPPTVVLNRKQDVLRFGSADNLVTYRGERVIHNLNHEFILDAQTDLKAFIDFFMARRGPWDSFWIPSWRGELKLDTGSISGPITTIDIRPVGYSTVYDPTTTNKADLGHFVWLYNYAGELNIYEVTSVSGSDPESLTVTHIDGNDTATYTERDLIGLMYHVRLAGNQIEFNFRTETLAQVRLPMVEVIGFDSDGGGAAPSPSLDFSEPSNSMYIPAI